MADSNLVLWQATELDPVPKSAKNASQIAPLAHLLREVDRNKVVQAFNAGLYELAVEYVWKRTMAILKRQLSDMGMSFIGEMLARPDVDEDSPVEVVVTDYEAIQLAYQLGIISKLGSIELRQAAELLAYYSSPDIEADVELNPLQALSLFHNCVSHILSRHRIAAAFDFAEFRRKLTQKVLPADDSDLHMLLAGPYFFKRTTVRVLLAEAKSQKGAQLENALENLTIILSGVWSNLPDPDRWQIGQAYAEANANNEKTVTTVLRRILMTLQGFDYVPETLRSSTYTRAASEVLSAHEKANNFYNEPAPMKVLASLGSTIPGPAFSACMRATLAVKLGNKYGYCREAQKHADKLLQSISQDKWVMYLSKFLPYEDLLLSKLMEEAPAKRWIELVNEYKFEPGDMEDKRIVGLIKASKIGTTINVNKWANDLSRNLTTRRN